MYLESTGDSVTELIKLVDKLRINKKAKTGKKQRKEA